MKENLELLQTLTSHICHDLAGSIGTIDNCLGLMETKDDSISMRAKLLANEESSNLIRKIEVFRECYNISNCKQEISVHDLSKTLKDFFANTKIQFTIHFEGEILLNPTLAKIVMCLSWLAKEQPRLEKIDLFQATLCYIGFTKNNIFLEFNGPLIRIQV